MAVHHQQVRRQWAAFHRAASLHHRHHPEVSGPVAVLPNEMAPLDADACKLIQGNFRDDLHHHRPEVSAHRQRILERPVEVVEVRPEVAVEVRPEVAVEVHRHHPEEARQELSAYRIHPCRHDHHPEVAFPQHQATGSGKIRDRDRS